LSVRNDDLLMQEKRGIFHKSYMVFSFNTELDHISFRAIENED